MTTTTKNICCCLEKNFSSYLSSVFSMIASRIQGSLCGFLQPKQLLFNRNSTDKFTIRDQTRTKILVGIYSLQVLYVPPIRAGYTNTLNSNVAIRKTAYLQPQLGIMGNDVKHVHKGVLFYLNNTWTRCCVNLSLKV